MIAQLAKPALSGDLTSQHLAGLPRVILSTDINWAIPLIHEDPVINSKCTTSNIVTGHTCMVWQFIEPNQTKKVYYFWELDWARFLHPYISFLHSIKSNQTDWAQKVMNNIWIACLSMWGQYKIILTSLWFHFMIYFYQPIESFEPYWIQSKLLLNIFHESSIVFHYRTQIYRTQSHDWVRLSLITNVRFGSISKAVTEPCDWVDYYRLTEQPTF